MAALAAQTDHAQAKFSGLIWPTFAGRVMDRLDKMEGGPINGGRVLEALHKFLQVQMVGRGEM